MSRMPVRDAIKRLHAEGLVTILPNRTVIVTQLGPDDVAEIFAIRAALERLAVRFASALHPGNDPGSRGPGSEDGPGGRRY